MESDKIKISLEIFLLRFNYEPNHFHIYYNGFDLAFLLTQNLKKNCIQKKYFSLGVVNGFR